MSVQKIVNVKMFRQIMKKQILKDYAEADHTSIISVPSASNVEDLTRFATMSKYFRGEHHLEEMMYQVSPAAADGQVQDGAVQA